MLLTHTKRSHVRSQVPPGARWCVEPRENISPKHNANGNQPLVQTSTGIWRVTYNALNRTMIAAVGQAK